MLPMGADHDAALAEFFAAPLAGPTSIAAVIAPGASAELRAQVTLPRDAVQPIRHGDRLLFVPLGGLPLLLVSPGGLPPLPPVCCCPSRFSASLAFLSVFTFFRLRRVCCSESLLSSLDLACVRFRSLVGADEAGVVAGAGTAGAAATR